MKDLLENDLEVGDKIAFLPRKEIHGGFQYNIQYGEVTRINSDNNAAYCKSLSERDYSEIMRYHHQIIKLNCNYE